MGFVLKRTVALLMLTVGLLAVGVAITTSTSLAKSFGQVAYAEDDCDDDECEDGGAAPAGGVNTGGGGTAESGDSAGLAAPIAVGSLGALVGGGTLLLRRRFAGGAA